MQAAEVFSDYSHAANLRVAEMSVLPFDMIIKGVIFDELLG